MKKLFFTLFLAAAAFCAMALNSSCGKKETAAEELNKVIEKNNAEDAALEPPGLPAVEENLFYSFFEGRIPDTVSFEGTVRAASAIPDPEENDYPNCLYAVFVELDSVLSSTPLSEQTAYEVIVNVPVMKDKAILERNIFQPGSRISCVCAEYDAMPQEIREIQLSDDIQSFEHQQYYALSIAKVKRFQKNGKKDFAKREITILPIQSLPKDENAAALRRERISNEIARIEKELKEHGGSFAAWRKKYEAIADKYRKLCKKESKLWIGDSFFAAGRDKTKYNTREYIDGILPYKKYLEENNIDLILVRVPHKGDFAACVLASEDYQENPEWVEHYYECLKNDIEIVDPMPEMWKHRFDFPLFYFYNVESETHPFEGQAFIAAQVLSEILKRYQYPASDKPVEVEDFVFETDQERYFWPKGNPKFDPKKNISFKQVVRDGKTIGELNANTGSPFLFLSNSFFWYPYRPRGASLPGYTAYFLQHVPDWFYQDAIHNQMIRNLICAPEALKKRRAVIMVKAPFMNSGGFPPFPRYLSEHAGSISMEKSMDFLDFGIKNLDNGSFLFTKGKDGLTYFIRNNDKRRAAEQFGIELTIPHCKDKTTCMLRINFGELSQLTLNVLDAADGSVLDTTSLTSGKNLPSDLFIPTLDSGRKVRVEFLPFFPENAFSVKNIELWYY
jgi:hypothetical protein